jgi:ribosome-associated protein
MSIPGLENVEASAQLREVIAATLEEYKAEDISVVDLAGKSSVADHMIVASGRSHRHVGSLADRTIERLKKAGVAALGVEGRRQADWVLLDLGEVIVHLFRPEVREFYNLEKMWAVPIPEQITH